MLHWSKRQIDREKNPDAQDLVMRGWAFYYGPLADRADAKRAFEKALTVDPESVGARVGLATVLVEDIGRGARKSRDLDMARVEKLTSEAIERDPGNAQAYQALGMLRRNQNRLGESRIELERRCRSTAMTPAPSFTPSQK
jgi:adenylate cyclase